MATESIGFINCPLCQHDAAVKETKKIVGGKPLVMTWCESCQCQTFPRGKKSSDIIRSQMFTRSSENQEKQQQHQHQEQQPVKKGGLSALFED